MTTDSPIYKIMHRADWMAACDSASYEGSPDDKRDGFIHFSTATQVPGTLEKHFAGQEGLVIAAFDPKGFGAALRWEASRKGELFPHLYATLNPHTALKVHALNPDAQGNLILPPLT
jgi:uncharacterized protein (DUF952 family)